MGMTPLEGLMMGTRSGSIDPGVMIRLLREGVAVDDLADGLEHDSGLLGVAGTADMRALVEAETAGDERAALAIDLFVRRAAESMAAAATALSRLDAVVFTGGIGEHAAPVREGIVGRLSNLGVRGPLATMDADALLTPAGRRPAVLAIEAREDLVIAEAARSVVAAG
jgi:acetate kinase